MPDLFRKSCFVRNPASSWLILFLSLLASALILRLSGLFVAWIHILLLGLCTLFLLFTRSVSKPENERERSSPWFSLGVALLSMIYLASPGEHLVGNWDPGVYLAQGAAVARETGWTVSDSAADVMTPEQRTIVYPRDRNIRVKVPGFYAPTDKPDQLIPQFYPLYPTLLSVAYRVGGIALALRVDSLCFLLGIILFADLAGRITKQRSTGLFCLLLTGLHPVVIWFARFHTSESLLFLLFAIFVWSSYRSILHQRRIDTILVGLSIALLPWVTPSALPVVFLLPAFLFFRRVPIGHRVWITAAGLTGALTLWLFLQWSNHPYDRHVLRLIPSLDHLIKSLTLHAVTWATAVAGVCAVGVVIARRMFNLLSRHEKWVNPVVLFTLVIASVISYRLLLSLPPFVNGIISLLPLPWWLCAIAGCMFLWRRCPDVRLWFCWLAAATAIVTVIFLLWPMVPQHYPWAWKRWVWILFPVVSMLAVIGIVSVLKSSALPRLWAVIILMALPVYFHNGLVRGGEWNGLQQWLATISDIIPDNALVMAPKELATPLEFIYGHKVIPVYGGLDTPRDNNYMKIWSEGTQSNPVWIVHWEKPYWIADSTEETVVLPPYEGEWIKQNRFPTDFRRQPRGFGIFVWVHEDGENND